MHAFVMWTQYGLLFSNIYTIIFLHIIISASDTSSTSYPPIEFIEIQKSLKKFKSYEDPKYNFASVKTDLGPPNVLKTFTRPPLAGPYAFSRIPKPHWNRPRVNVPHEIRNTWLFLSTQAG